MAKSPEQKGPKLRPFRGSSLAQALQGNFDHLMGVLRNIARAHNVLVDDIQGMSDTIEEVIELGGSHSHDGTSSTPVDHDTLTGVSADDHHNQAHDQGDHNAAEAADIAAVAAAAAAGSSVEVPNADHVHPHGTGYAGGHSDAVNDGDAAGGDLSGTYPNPSVVDDSHSHGSGTAPGTAHPNLATHDALGLATDAELTTHTGLPNAHHNQDHASRHSNGGADEVTVENLGTAETDTSKRLAPDGAGGLTWGTGGGGGASLDVQQDDVSVEDPVDTLDFLGDGFTLFSPGAGEVEVELNYGITNDTPARGDHGHALDDLQDVDLDFDHAHAVDDLLALNGSGDWYAARQIQVETLTADTLFGGGLGLAEGTPSQLTGDVDDYDAGGLINGAHAVIRLRGISGGTAAAVTGLIGFGNSQLLVLENASTVASGEGTITLRHQSTSSSAANRIICPGEVDFSLPPASSVVVVYDVTASRWRVIEQTGSSLTTKRVWLPARAGELDSTTTSTENQAGTTPDRYANILMSDGATEGGLFAFIVPDDWSPGTAVSLKLYYAGSSAFNGTVAWRQQINYAHVADSAAADLASTVITTNVVPANTYASGDLVIDTARSLGTPAAAGNLIRIQVQRVGSNAADTYTGNIRLIGVLIEYTAAIPTGPQGPAGPAGASGISGVIVQEADSTVASAATTLDFGAGFDVTESPAGEANVALDLSEVSTQHDALDHSTALGTAVIDDLSDVSITGLGSGDYMVYNGSAWANAAASDAANNPGAFRKSIKVGTATWMFHDFLLAQAMSDIPALSTGSAGAGAAIALATSTDKNHPGLISLNCGTTSTGNVRAGNGTAISDLPVGGGVIRFGWWVKTPAALSDATNTYTVRVGITDALPSGSPANGARFNYSHGTNSGKWQAEVIGSGGSTTGDATVTVQADTWYFLEVVFNAGGTAVDFYVNEVFKVTVTRTVAGNINTPGGVVLTKSAGTASRTLLWDGYYGEVFFTSDR